jgi:aminoglycoside phosphotransferase (APT) family kinase protein
LGDAFTVALRALEQLGRMTRDRLGGRRRADAEGIPGDLDAIDETWMTQALQACFPGVRVREVERLGGDSGTTTRERIRLDYDETGEGSAPPETMFVKATPRALGVRLFSGLLGLGACEVGFYRDLRGAAPVHTPRAYCARSADRSGRFVLLLEDLAASDCRFETIASRISPEQAGAVVAALGRLHATFWETPRFAGDLAWLKSRENNPNERVERLISAHSNARALAKFGDLVPPRVRRDSHLVHESRDLLEEYWARGPRTVIHGDSHAGNLYFRGEEPGLLDWQVVQKGQGIRDVGYFMINSLSTPVRRSCERELLELYRATLAANGVAAPDSGELWERYRTHALYAWIASAVTVAAGRLQPESISRLALERSGAALEDLESLEALRVLRDRRGS